MPVYPYVDEVAVAPLQRAFSDAAQQVGYADGSTYPDWLKDALRRHEPVSVDDLDVDEALPRWVERLLDDLESMRGADIKTLDPAAQRAYLTMGAKLTKELLEMKERIANADKARQFMATVTTLLEEMIPENIVGEFMSRLKAEMGKA